MTPQLPSALLEQISRVARTLSAAQVDAVAKVLERTDTTLAGPLRSQLVLAVPQPRLQSLLADLARAVEAQRTVVPAATVAAMLRAAEWSVRTERAEQAVELVWTGPELMDVPLRRTEQVLLELIEEARETLLIVSYAVYMVPTIATALTTAAQRGVQIDICIEAPEPAGQALDYDTIAALGADVRASANIYVWPRAHRPTAPNGTPAALHAKCAVADSRRLLLTSANLTGHALTINLELGVVINGGPLPERIQGYFTRLIHAGIFVQTDL